MTISGPKDVVSQFVAELQAEGVFAKEINTSQIAYHSYFMQSIAHPLMKKFELILTNPKQRSSRWISTSIPETHWETSAIANHCSAAYLVNNVTAPVLFYEAVKKIPANAVAIEVRTR